MSDDQAILVRYIHGNRGQHAVIGHVSKKFYGYRAGGDSFLVLREDVQAAPHLFVPVENITQASQEPRPVPVQEFDAEAYLEKYRNKWNKELDLQSLPGVTPTVEKNMKASGFTTREAILKVGSEGLQDAVKGIGAAKAEAIVAFLESVDG